MGPAQSEAAPLADPPTVKAERLDANSEGTAGAAAEQPHAAEPKKGMFSFLF
mgnify:CR=1 FL=1